jgi:hypothetical protein
VLQSNVPRTQADQHKRLLEQRLENAGLVRLKMDSDGNCQFRSVAQELYGSPHRHKEVRDACVDYIGRNPDQFSIFFETGHQFESYRTKMKRDRVWGDEITLRAISDIYQTRIHLLTSDKGAFYHVYQPEAGLPGAFSPGANKHVGKNIFLVYFNRCHYDVLSLQGYSRRRESDIADSARKWLVFNTAAT